MMSVLRKRGPLERDSETQRTLRNGPQNFPWRGDGLLTAPPSVTQYPRADLSRRRVFGTLEVTHLLKSFFWHDTK